RVNSDGTFDIDYDDGEKERGLAEEHIKPVETGNGGRSPSGGGGLLREGDKVEARYRGRGKYYRGTISRVNLDNTFDIDYDDGEKERGLAEEHIKPLGGGGSGRSNRAGAMELVEGDKVEANYRGKGRFYKGRVGRVNLDGSYNIDYDDGEKERGVPADMVRGLSSGGRDDGGRGGSRLREGDKVEARYRGRGKYYKGKISRVNSDGTFDINYDDGERERGLAVEHVK
ncbi:unnamed protein product, partial [Discosporangium mesarthrocarpum]